MRFFINFDIKHSKLISKTITVVSATQKTKQLNQTWTNPIKVGDKITVILKNNNPKFELSVNNVAINGFLNDNTIKDVTLVTYGGGWKMNGASLIGKGFF
uniref:Galectin n=1 Tax=Panagrolaimus sp. PS1159 TaxID=55785 RepID=A0AC35F8E2_9BILA